MGRYYNGDIEGKFWVAVQASDDASFFGGRATEPNHITYYFDERDDLESLEKGLRTCLDKLGNYKKELDDFFEKNNGYNEQIIVEQTSFENEEDVKKMLVWYARYKLGKKIQDKVIEQGHCEFNAEL